MCSHDLIFTRLFPVAVIPKRESSKRRAKDSAKRSTQVLNAGDDEDDIQDIDLEDSDEDESWTPFKVSLTSIFLVKIHHYILLLNKKITYREYINTKWDVFNRARVK